MGRLTSKLVQTATRIMSTRNEYGDDVWSGTEAGIPCLYRDISSVTRQGATMNQVNFDGIIWFDADRTVLKGETYLIDSVYYRIERVIIARRRLLDNTIDFIKCEATKQRQVS